mgnify:CR=1 FL=1
MDIAREIKRQLSMDEVVRYYGFVPNGGGYIACPYHKEKTPSLKVYAEPGRGWHCYGCNEGGSVIDFVMALFNIPFTAAVVRLNADFHLGLTNDDPDPRELERLKAERLSAQKADARREAEYMAKTYEYRRLWNAKLHKAPKSPDEPFHPEYIEACKKLDALDWWFVEHPYKRGEQYQ